MTRFIASDFGWRNVGFSCGVGPCCGVLSELKYGVERRGKFRFKCITDILTVVGGAANQPQQNRPDTLGVTTALKVRTTN